MMCAKKWNVEKELASHQVLALSSLSVNVRLGGSRLALMVAITSTFSLA
jgi:hypothetical protein